MPAFVSIVVFAPIRHRYVDTRTGVRLSTVWVKANQKKRSAVGFDLDIRI